MNFADGSGADALLPPRRLPFFRASVAVLTKTVPISRTRVIYRAGDAGDGANAEQAVGQRQSYRNFLQHGPGLD